MTDQTMGDPRVAITPCSNPAGEASLISREVQEPDAL